MRKKLPLVNALAWIVASTILITGTATYLLKKKGYRDRNEFSNAAYHIVTIVQTGPQKEALKTTYLAELMGLSIDRPQTIYSFDTVQAQKDLLRSHVIKEAKVKILPPKSVYVDYTVRQPIALLYQYENIAIDAEGYLFPLLPFFPPKKLPEIYLKEPFKNPLQGADFELAKTFLQLLEIPLYKNLIHVKRIDLSHIFATSYGRREIVLQLEDEVLRREGDREVLFLFPRLLRLSTKNYAAELGNYLKLREQLLIEESKKLKTLKTSQEIYRFPEKIIDLRLPSLAFIE